MLTHRMQQTYDLFWSGMSLATFWLVGAAVFNALEGWGYGWVEIEHTDVAVTVYTLLWCFR